MLDRLRSTFDACYADLDNEIMQSLLTDLPKTIEQRFNDYTHGFMPQWLDIIDTLPRIKPGNCDLKNAVSIGDSSVLDEAQRQQLAQSLKQFHPWRKGPYYLHGLHIDTEWRSDWKWDRLSSHISSLDNRTVLDIGCGSGYHCWRMYGAGAKLVLGIDPSQLFMMQFLAIKHFIGASKVHYLPLGIEHLGHDLALFDTVFSMGVLYHRQSPFEHLAQLRGLLREGGELVLETLVIDGDSQSVLLPQRRYASMKNVWFLPSALALEGWLKRAGFKNIRTVDINQTSNKEQRSTEWMHFHSLKEYLSADDSNSTIEGYPAPKRAMVIAEK